MRSVAAVTKLPPNVLIKSLIAVRLQNVVAHGDYHEVATKAPHTDCFENFCFSIVCFCVARPSPWLWNLRVAVVDTATLAHLLRHPTSCQSFSFSDLHVVVTTSTASVTHDCLALRHEQAGRAVHQDTKDT